MTRSEVLINSFSLSGYATLTGSTGCPSTTTNARRPSRSSSTSGWSTSSPSRTTSITTPAASSSCRETSEGFLNYTFSKYWLVMHLHSNKNFGGKWRKAYTDHGAQRLGFFDFTLIVPLSDQFCLAWLELGRSGRAVG